MNKYKTLLSNTLLISMGTFGSKLLVFLMVRFYTEYLTASDYSTADLITQTANLLFPVISMGITDGVFRFCMDSNSDRKSIFTVGIYSILCGSLLFFGVVPILGLVNNFSGHIWLIVVYTLACSFHSLCAQYIRAIGKTAFFAVQGIINTALVIVLNISFLTGIFGVKLGMTGYVLSVVLADSLCTAFIFIKEKLWRVITLKPDLSVIKPMLKYSIPLIPSTVFWWITSVSDRYMVNSIISSSANGIYTVSYKIPTLLTLVATIFMQAWQFSAVTESEGDEKEHAEFFSSVWRSFQAVLFLCGSFLIAFCKPAIAILTAKEYRSAWEYVPVLSLAMIFTAFVSFTGTVYIVKKKSGISFLTAFVGAATNISLNFLLIPSPLGVQGAAIATVLSYFFVFVIRCFNVKRYIPFKLYGMYIIINTVVITLQAMAMILQVKGYIIIQAVCIIILALVNYKFLIGFINKILGSVLRRTK